MAHDQPGPRDEPPPADHTSTLNLGALSADADVDARADDHPAGAEPVEALAPGTALLVVQRGPNAGSRYLLDADSTSVGRHPDAVIFLDDVTVSRRHAEFRREGAGFRVVDVGSLNGTYVNRHRIDDVVLASGDEVQIGKYRLLYLSGVPADTP
jgi:pSer/pThr/pTyr-binding forkhead associated (FHA) protein